MVSALVVIVQAVLALKAPVCTVNVSTGRATLVTSTAVVKVAVSHEEVVVDPDVVEVVGGQAVMLEGEQMLETLIPGNFRTTLSPAARGASDLNDALTVLA